MEWCIPEQPLPPVQSLSAFQLAFKLIVLPIPPETKEFMCTPQEKDQYQCWPSILSQAQQETTWPIHVKMSVVFHMSTISSQLANVLSTASTRDCVDSDRPCSLTKVGIVDGCGSCEELQQHSGCFTL